MNWTLRVGLGGLLVLTIVPVNVDGQNPVSRSIAARQGNSPIIIRERQGKEVTSTNWSGYAVTGDPAP